MHELLLVTLLSQTDSHCIAQSVPVPHPTSRTVSNKVKSPFGVLSPGLQIREHCCKIKKLKGCVVAIAMNE